MFNSIKVAIYTRSGDNAQAVPMILLACSLRSRHDNIGIVVSNILPRIGRWINPVQFLYMLIRGKYVTRHQWTCATARAIHQKLKGLLIIE